MDYNFDVENNQQVKEYIIKNLQNHNFIVIIDSQKRQHLAYYNVKEKRYYTIDRISAKQHSYSNFLDAKKHIKFIFEIGLFLIDNKIININEELSDHTHRHYLVSLQCCMKTLGKKKKRCRNESYSHGSFCKFHYQQLFNILGKKLPDDIIHNIVKVI